MTPPAALESQIRALMEEAEQARLTGDQPKVDRLIAQARSVAPEHTGVLNVAGLRALGRGDAAGARHLFEQALSLEPETPMLWLHLALAIRDLGDQQGEREALERALQIDPRYFPALLHKARLFERQGNTKLAARMYYAFICCLPAGVPQPPDVREAVQHANAAIRRNDAALESFLRPRLEELRARHAGSRLERFDACLDTLVGRRQMFAPQPTFLNFPRLPAIEFLDREQFPWLSAFEAATAEIREEAHAALDQAAAEFVPYIAKPAGSPVDQWAELNHSKRWSSFFLIKNGVRNEDRLARCPKTAALLESAPLCRIPGHAPSVFFSVLAPKTRIPGHTGVTNTRFIVHVPLIIPPGCWFRVGAEKREWREGHAWVFDDTFDHEAWNGSDEPRVILILDTWNSFLSEAERDLVAALTHGVQEFNDVESPFQQGG